MNGILVLDKPSGITSRDAVNHLQKWFPRKTKLGHTGTLDPLATGVLVVCVGMATRLAEYVQGLPKSYRTTVRFGYESTTDDADGELTEVPTSPLDEARLRTALAAFSGEIDQVPPAFSAVKVEGHRAHALARVGDELTLTARKVRLDRIDIIRYEWPMVELEIYCGKGTYIRSIARDLGRALGTAAYVMELRRLSVGPFTPDQAVPWDSPQEVVRASLRPIRDAVSHLASITFTEEESIRFRMGQPVEADSVGEGEVAVYLADGSMVGVGVMEIAKGIRPIRILQGIQ